MAYKEKYTPKHKAGESIYFDGKYRKILHVDDYRSVMYQLEFGVHTDAKKADEREELQLRRDAGNIDKAKELALKKFCVYDEEIDNVVSLLIEMAAWKEQQLIKKACEWLNEVVKDEQSKYVWYDSEEGFDGITEDLVEDFKKAMEE